MQIYEAMKFFVLTKAGLKRVALLLLLFTVVQFPAHAHALEAEEDRVVHLVVMWFENNGTAEQRKTIIEATRGFAQIPGVLEIRVGEQLKTGRTGEKWFSIAATVVLENRAALKTYGAHPIHQAALNSDMLKGLQRLETYDFIDR